jgi:2-keto-4-pentenoate hydratase
MWIGGCKMTSNPRGAAQFLHDLGRTGERVDGLPETLRPRTRGEGYEIQSMLQSMTEQSLFAWKLAATSKPGQEHIGVDGPMIGRILDGQVIANGGSYVALERNIMRVAELEFAFRFATEIAPQEAPWRMEEGLARVESLHPAIEIPDSRYRRYESVGEAQLIADNACAHFFVLGEPAPDEWRNLDLAEHLPWGCIDAKRFRQGMGRNVLGDPRTALLWFLDETSRYRMTIHAGDIVTTGTCLQPIPISHGMTVAGDFGMLGFVSVNVE